MYDELNNLQVSDIATVNPSIWAAESFWLSAAGTLGLQ